LFWSHRRETVVEKCTSITSTNMNVTANSADGA